MVTTRPDLTSTSTFVKTVNGPRHSKTLFRQVLGHAKIHCPQPQMSTSDIDCYLIKLGLKPLHFNVIA
jgi:hypothetical protein